MLPCASVIARQSSSGLPFRAGDQNGDDVNAKLIFLFTEAITDPAKMLTLFDNAAYAGQDWVHLCTWDMLVSFPIQPNFHVVVKHR